MRSDFGRVRPKTVSEESCWDDTVKATYLMACAFGIGRPLASVGKLSIGMISRVAGRPIQSKFGLPLLSPLIDGSKPASQLGKSILGAWVLFGRAL